MTKPKKTGNCKRKKTFAKKVVFWGPGLAGHSLKNQEKYKGFGLLAELGQQSKSSAELSSAQLGRAEPSLSSAQLELKLEVEPGLG